MPPTTPKPYRDLPGAAQRKRRPGTQSGTQPIARDTLQLLWAGVCFFATGILSILLIDFVFGGMSRHGPHTDGGWTLLVLAFACVPLGLLLLLLGGAKWLGKRWR